MALLTAMAILTLVVIAALIIPLGIRRQFSPYKIAALGMTLWLASLFAIWAFSRDRRRRDEEVNRTTIGVDYSADLED